MSRPLMLATTVPGLRLIALQPEHAAAYYALVDRNRDHLTQHGDYLDLGEATSESVEEELGEAEPGVVLGYWLGAEWTGNGYATAAGAALIAYGAAVLGAQTVWAGVTKGNVQSEAVLARLGFRAVSDQGTYTRFCRQLA